MSGKVRKKHTVTLVVTCVGRRVELLQAFRRAADALGVNLVLVGTDSVTTAPGLACVDRAVILPPIEDPNYITALLACVDKHHAGCLLPTIDTDLLAIARHRNAFAEKNCAALIAEPDIIATCRDKIATFEFLRANEIDTPQTYTPAEIAAATDVQFPLFIKPRNGSASMWVQKLDDRDDLTHYLRKIDNPIVQEFVSGVEHTLDVYVGLNGRPRCVVPRARWQVRGGEVSKGVVVKDLEVMEAGRRVVEALGESVRGLVTLQCIVTPQRRIRFIEINPRFGGGAPLGIAAGADYPRWLLQELLGDEPDIAFDGFEDGLCMLRYDWSAFVPLGSQRKPRLSASRQPFPTFDPRGRD